MMSSNFYETTVSSLSVRNLNNNFYVGNQNYNVTRVFYSYLFSSSDSLKEKNKALFRFLLFNLKESNSTVSDFVTDNALWDLDVSLIKTVSIVIQDEPKLASYHSRMTEFLKARP